MAWSRGARWAVPATIGVLVLGGSVLGPGLAASGVDLPDRTPEQVLTDLQTADVEAFSGTVAHTADLGLPTLPTTEGPTGTDLTALLDGTSTLRVWSAGPEHSRVSLHGPLGEVVVVRDGAEVWTWSSDDGVAQHLTLPAHTSATGPAGLAAELPPMTPEQVTDLVLTMLGPTTTVGVGPDVVVAGRPAYQLVLTPAEPGSLVASVTIAVDAAEHVPTRVQVHAVGHDAPALEVGFTELTFAEPDPALLTFTPPPGATVEELGPLTPPGPGEVPAVPDDALGPDDVSLVGRGWATVLVLRTAGPATGSLPEGLPESMAGLDGVVGALPQVSGPWGSGRLLTSRLFSVLLADDGRVLVGAVDGDTLQAAAGDPAASAG